MINGKVTENYELVLNSDDPFLTLLAGRLTWQLRALVSRPLSASAVKWKWLPVPFPCLAPGIPFSKIKQCMGN